VIAKNVVKWYIEGMPKRVYNIYTFFGDLKEYWGTINFPVFDITSRREVELKILLPLMEDILAHADDPTIPIDTYIRTYWRNRDYKYAKGDDIWVDILHYTNELENYDPNPEFRQYGFADARRAIMITKRMVGMIKEYLDP